MRSTLVMISLGLAVGINPVQAQALPILKNGVCPIGYTTQGNYCVPGRQAPVAIPKLGVCPINYVTQGNYCVGNQRAKPAVIKSGVCPSGYFTQGNYCVSQ
ncbi:hypothetical protein RIF25_07865 [Thermosynechococcaceae cyanobacterium BACA0444]|uniref:Secreted protein n=1 Tax=Pseudocalidococcus azoricus BACA0444 TaxID=2918990 RepID=A0AAE4JX25_9CYAN|nr:hypothetical protein [Pseudocalidococcus azoricus]MDS3860728.1 hypothetical protein [Pseudocalidococcus azoricus BACA0444]